MIVLQQNKDLGHKRTDADLSETQNSILCSICILVTKSNITKPNLQKNELAIS
jgi:hypothetical protein